MKLQSITKMKIYKKQLLPFLCLTLLCFFLTGRGPSDEKVMEAQQKYTELTDAHNQVVEAHKSVEDNSLDEGLAALKEKVTVVESYNLQELKDEEIDLLIQTMDALIASYDEFFTALTTIKENEEAAVLTPIPITLINNTEFSFSTISLFEQGNHQVPVNILENLPPFAPGQTLTGLLVQRDVDGTPWVLSITDTEGISHEITLSVTEYNEEGISLSIIYQEEEQLLTLE